MTASFNLDTIRIMLHVLGVTVWLGGQIVLLALLPTLRAAGADGLVAAVARAFQRVAWPAYGLTFVTGIWNLLAVGIADTTMSYRLIFTVKFTLVIISGVAAFWHAQTTSPALKGIMGALGFLGALAAFVLGYVLSYH